MRSTFGAARQRQQMVNTESRPFWQYDARNDSRVRPSHAAMDGMVFPADDPIWASHHPPNRWNCRCRVRALTPEQVQARGLRVRSSEGALEEVEQEVGVDRRTGEVVNRPGTAYRFQTATGERTSRCCRTRRGGPGAASPAAARERLAAATASARRRLAEREEALQRANAAINDPATRSTAEDFAAREALKMERRAALIDVRTAGRRAILREQPAPWSGGGAPSWADEELRRQYSATVDEWRRLVARDLVGRPVRIRVSVMAARANYPLNYIELGARGTGGSAADVVHELSHLREADPRVFRRAVGFLARRTVGDELDVVDSRPSLGRRDAWRRPDGLRMVEQFYPGRVYAASGRTDGDGWHRATLPGAPCEPAARRKGDRGAVDVYATEILSMGMEYLWQDPVAFAEADPEYFDFVWDTVVRGGPL